MASWLPGCADWSLLLDQAEPGLVPLVPAKHTAVSHKHSERVKMWEYKRRWGKKNNTNDT